MKNLKLYTSGASFVAIASLLFVPTHQTFAYTYTDLSYSVSPEGVLTTTVPDDFDMELDPANVAIGILMQYGTSTYTSSGGGSRGMGSTGSANVDTQTANEFLQNIGWVYNGGQMEIDLTPYTSEPAITWSDGANQVYFLLRIGDFIYTFPVTMNVVGDVFVSFNEVVPSTPLTGIVDLNPSDGVTVMPVSTTTLSVQYAVNEEDYVDGITVRFSVTRNSSLQQVSKVQAWEDAINASTTYSYKHRIDVSSAEVLGK